MNEQNNNFNSQLNNQNQMPQNNGPQPVKNRFFSPDLFQDVGADSVGSSMSNNVSNKVISWGVGGAKSNPTQATNVNNNVMNKNLNNYQGQLMEQVNGVVYTDEQPEILDDSFLYGDNQESNLTLQDSPLFQSVPNDNIVNNAVNNNQIVNQNMDTQNINNMSGITEDWMNHQPLSASSLGVGMQSEGERIEVEEQNRFFDKNISSQGQTQIEQHAQQALQQGNGIMLEDPLPEVDNNKLIIDYVGNKYTKISMSPFSFSAFLFNGCYFAFRKMFLFGIILCLISIGIFYFVPFPYQLIVFFVMSIIIGLIANPLYLKVVKGRVKRIRKKHKKDNQINLSMICKKKGGINFVVFLMLFILYISAMSFLTYAYIVPEVVDLIQENRLIENGDNSDQYKFDGNILFEEYDIEKKFNIVIPETFVKDDDKIFKYRYVESNSTGENNSCILTFSKVYGFQSSEEAINEIAEYENATTEIDSVVSNGINWNTLSVEKDNYDIHYRSTMVDNDVILFQYESGTDVSFGVCDTYLVDIMLSLTTKGE